MSGYQSYARTYFEHGWAPLPVPHGRKKPPPDAWTGLKAPYPGGADVEAWIAVSGQANIALRLPFTVIGLDVDCYDGKPGAANFAALIEEFGPLPATVRSTSRDDGLSGIRFYRVPEDWRPARKMPRAVDLIWAGYRYAMVWPSTHPNGNEYGWLGLPDGVEIPEVKSLPLLPQPWLDGLATPAPWEPHASGQGSRYERTVGQGERQSTCVSLAGWLRNKDVPLWAAEAWIEKWHVQYVLDPDLPRHDPFRAQEALLHLRDVYNRYPPGAVPEETEQDDGQGWGDVGLDEIVAEDVATLWDGFLVVGALNLLIGEEGTGKSLLAANLIVRASRGELSPDGRPVASLVIGAEDSIEAVWKPRCFAAGERDGRLIRFRPSRVNPVTGEIDEAPEFSNPAVLNSLLYRWARKHGPSLIYLDHLSAVVPSSSDTLKYDDAGGVLRAVNALAERHGHCVVGGWHFNKGTGRVRSRVMNSTGVLASVRNALALVRSEDDGTRYVALVKSATGDTTKPAVRFRVGSVAVFADGRPRDTARAHGWGRVADGRGGLAFIEDVLARNDERARQLAKPLTATDWLRVLLTRFGPLPRAEVVAAASELGFGLSTIERAATKLRVADGSGNWSCG